MSGSKTPGKAGRRHSRATGRVRIEEVARIAAVSAQTVSRYQRDLASVAPATAERIRIAIDKTGYVPNRVAGSLASNRSFAVAIIVPTLVNPGHAAPVQGLTDALGPAGYQVLVGSTGYSREAEREIVAAFLGRRVDGVVITGGSLDPTTRRMLIGARVPVVQLYELPADPIDMAVGFSNAAAGAAMAAHFAVRGYRRPVVIAHAAASDTRANARVEGFVAETLRHGLEPPQVIAVAPPADLQRGREVLDAVLAWPGADAVFAVSDLVAIGLALACARRGVAVPARLAIAGCGDIDVAAALVPSLTTLRIPRYALGHRAGELLLARFTGQPVETPVQDLGFELLVREST